jgi:cerevisin
MHLYSLLAVAGTAATLVGASPIGGLPDDHSRSILAPLYTPSAPQPPDWYAGEELGQDTPFMTTTFAGESHLIPDSYIVVYKRHVQPHHHAAHKQRVGRFHAETTLAGGDVSAAGLTGFIHDYGVSGALRGYSGRFSEQVVNHIRAQPEVAYVERDSRVWAYDLEKGAPWVRLSLCSFVLFPSHATG